MCFVWIWEQTAVASLYNINWPVFVIETLNILGCQFLDTDKPHVSEGWLDIYQYGTHIDYLWGSSNGLLECRAKLSEPGGMYVGGTESILMAQTDLMLIVIANVLGFQSQCKSVRLTIQYRLWSTALFEIQWKLFVFRVGVTYWHIWGPRERATAVRFPVRARVFVAKMFTSAVGSTQHNRGSFP